MKLLLFIFCFLLRGVLPAQSICLQLGRSLMPADHVSLRYEHWSNSAINLSLGGFMERSRKNNLNYSAFGVELLSEYSSNPEGYTGGVFGFRCGAGVSWQIENEPWVYQGWPGKKRTGYGLLCEAGGEWFMTENFSLRAIAQQKILFNQDIGRYRFMLGLSVAYRLSGY